MGGQLMAKSISDIAADLRRLIDDTKQKELECRLLLQYVPELLTDKTFKQILYIEPEYRGKSGDSDYVISFEIYGEGGVDKKYAYIWELKAPQCYVFEHETENRVKPSEDLIKAENQLLHYYDDQQGNDRFRQDFKIITSDDIKFGGIIIGSQKTRIKGGNYTPAKIDTLYQAALGIREKYFYRGRGIRLLLWDFVYQYLLRSTTEFKEAAEISEISAISTLSVSTIADR
jgi:hypothetical protein